MGKYIFSGESCTQGITCFSGKNLENGRIYRWEPLATRLRGDEAVNFRRKGENRARQLPSIPQEAGVLKVEGPITYRSNTLLGWEALSGEPLFSNFPSKLPVQERIEKLKPLLNSYRLYHSLGLIVGNPDWKRIYLGAKGIFTPDPVLLNYLASPILLLPPGLLACYPPEVYSGAPLDEKGDMFFLGLIIYLLLTANIPYPLLKGWPTEALLTGKIISPTDFCPELYPDLVQQMKKLLSPDPEERPSSEELGEFWQKAQEGVDDRIREVRRPPRKFSAQGIYRNVQLKGKWGRKIVVTVGGFFFLLLLLTLFWRSGEKFNPTATVMLEEIIDRLSDPTVCGYLLPSQPEIWADLLVAKEKRWEAASLLLSYPLLEVEEVNEVRIEPNWAQLEVGLVWHLWENDRWHTRKTREMMMLEKKGSQWEIKERQKID